MYLNVAPTLSMAPALYLNVVPAPNVAQTMYSFLMTHTIQSFKHHLLLKLVNMFTKTPMSLKA